MKDPLEADRRPFFTPKSLAAYLSVTDRMVRKLLQRGEIPSYTIGSARRIDPADVDEYLARRRQERS